ncbi:MAG: hypothetical protein GY811_27215 [Myxococcales bacterium]|nr:hypothetical protein [Myxococcales bacterium]
MESLRCIRYLDRQGYWDNAQAETPNRVYRPSGGYVIDLDIRSYFDSVNPKLAQRIIRKRVRDGVVRRLIGKWLNAGVMKNGLYRPARPSQLNHGVDRW